MYMKIIFAPLQTELMDLLEISHPLTSIFYFGIERIKPIWLEILDQYYIVRFEYNDTYETEYTDTVRDISLLEILFEIRALNKDLILTLPIQHFNGVKSLIHSEPLFQEVEIECIMLPLDSHELHTGTFIYRQETREEKDENGHVRWDLEQLYPYLGRHILNDSLKGKSIKEILSVNNQN